MKKLDGIKFIIFDLDGTLVDAFGAVTQSLNHMFDKMGYPRLSRESVKRKVGWGESALVRSVVSPEDLEKGLRIYRKHHKDALPQGVKFLPYAKQTLEYLKLSGYKMAVASNRPTRFSKIILKELKLKTYMSDLICADHPDVRKKPSPDMLKFLLKKHGFKPKESVYVGDMTIDAECARKARMKSFIVLTGSSFEKDIKEVNPDFIIPRIHGMKQYL